MIKKGADMKKLKKYFYVTCIVSAMIFSFSYSGSISRADTVATQEPETLDGFVIEGTTLISYKGTDTKVIVPEGITVIGEKAFAYSNTLLDEIVLPDSVTELEDYAFYQYGKKYNSIKKITFGENIQKIGEKAIGFYYSLPYYTTPADESQQYDWITSGLRLYGPEDSPVKDYADTYGIAYNDKFICRMDVSHASSRYESTTSLVIDWDAQYSVDGYYVYRSETPGGSFEHIETVVPDEYKHDGRIMTYTDKGLTPEKTYYYQIRSYRKSLNDDTIITSDTYAQVSRSPKLSPLRLLVYNSTATTLRIVVKKNYYSDAEGYYVFRADKEDGEFKKVATVKGFSDYFDKKLETGKSYYYKLIAYKGEYKSPASNIIRRRVIPNMLDSFEADWLSPTSAYITWSKAIDCDGYVLYRTDQANRNDVWVRLKTFKTNRTLSYKDKGLKKGHDYTYSIRAYKKVNGKNIYGREIKASLESSSSN